MSKYKKYVTDMDTKARDILARYQEAEKALEISERMMKKYPQKSPCTPEYALKSSKALYDYESARAALKGIQGEISTLASDSKKSRAALVSELEKDNRVDPSAVDGATMELLKSGILTPSDFKGLLEHHASNKTMTRLITKAISDRADTENDRNRKAEYLTLISNARAKDRDKLADYDTLTYVLERASNNPRMLSNWDNLTSGVIEDF